MNFTQARTEFGLVSRCVRIRFSFFSAISSFFFAAARLFFAVASFSDSAFAFSAARFCMYV